MNFQMGTFKNDHIRSTSCRRVDAERWIGTNQVSFFFGKQILSDAMFDISISAGFW